MNATAAADPRVLPESAPFTPEQRAWLNGFFAGLLSARRAASTPLSPEETAGADAGHARRAPTARARSTTATTGGALARPGHAARRPHEARRKAGRCAGA